MLFGKKIKPEPYEKENKIPVIRASICTGEKVAGFKDIRTGKFEEVSVIRNQKDMDIFLKKYAVSEESIKKEW